MSKDEFCRAFRGRLLLHLTESYAARRSSPSELGLLIDKHHQDCQRMLCEIYDVLCPEVPAVPIAPPGPRLAANGHRPQEARR